MDPENIESLLIWRMAADAIFRACYPERDEEANKEDDRNEIPLSGL